MRTSVAALTLAVAVVNQHAGPALELPGLGELLTAYRTGAFESAIEQLATVPDAELVRTTFIRGAEAWIASAPGEAEDRRLVATAFAVELAHARLARDNLTLIVLLDWATKEWRKGSVTPAERLWTHAAVALVERGGRTGYLFPPPGVRDRRWGESIVRSAAGRFPDDMRLRLAQVIWTVNSLGRRDLERLSRDPLVGPEALLQLAYLSIEGRDYPNALRLAREAANRAHEAPILYLARFMMGFCHQAQGRAAEAVAEYAAALRAVPHGQSASIALAVLLARDNQGDAAFGLVDRSLAEHPTGDDPWRLFYYGGYVRWPLVIARLREAIR